MRKYNRIILWGLLLLMSALMVWQPSPAKAASNDNNVEWSGLGHNSRDPLYRSPTGAVTTGTPIRLRLRAADNDLTLAQVRVWNDRINVSTVYNMTRVASNVVFSGDPTPYEFWEVTLPASALPTVYWYRFIAIDGTDTDYYEDDGARTGGWGQAYDNSVDNSWQLTIYDAGFSTPSWVQNAVIYQIFPDRFRDGNSANNPSAGEFFYGNYDTIYRSNATNWNTPICDPRSSFNPGTTCPGIWSQNFYGGDLQGIIDQLDYIRDLGVTAIYLNPIFESPSNHKYDTTDFFVIDDNFGDLATFHALVAGANARNIRIILDGVFNHSSSDSVYFDRYGRWQNSSSPGVFPTLSATDMNGACETSSGTFTAWYTFFPYVGTPPAPCSDNRDYPKWFGIFDSLPVYQHDYGPVRNYFITNGVNSVGPYWIAQGASGWRLDVAPEIDHGTINDPTDNYWEAFRTAVRAIDPDVYIVGEEWGNATSWTIGGEWDATMNYQFSAAVLSFWRDTAFSDNDFNSGSSAGVLNPLDANGVNERLLNLKERYAPPAFYAMMNLFGSHDTNRVLFLLDHSGSTNPATYNNPAYDWSDAISRLRGAALMQMTMPGAPTIYYGDEIGLVGPVGWDGSQWQDDPYNRQPYPWLDETGTPFYNHLQSTVARDALYNYYATLTDIRHSNPALRTGSFDPLYTSGDIYAYGRKMGDDSNTVIVVVNGTNTAQSATINVSGYIPAGSSLTDLLTSTAYTVNSSGEIVIASLPARGGVILRLNTVIARPACISDLVATGGAGQVSLSWSAAMNATVYNIYRSRLSGGGYDLIVANHPTTSYIDTTVANATTYYYRVVGKNGTTLLTSDLYCNNEASATPALTITWANLQWPHEIGNGSGPQPIYTLSATTPTTTIYGQLYVAGVTDGSGTNATGITAQVGYGLPGVPPTDPSWTWFPMVYARETGGGNNNDEYEGTLLPTSIGTFRYTTRWSSDGGLTWVYTDRNAPPYDEPDSGLLVVSPPSDTTPPAAPTNLTVLATSNTSVTLGWDAHPNTDGDLYGFRVYRQNTASPGFSLIATVVGASAVQYIDATVTSGENYDYYITAIDTTLNESLPSNTVNADAVLRLVSVTFVATVPNPSPGTIHIVGNFNGWNPSDPAYAMTQTGPNTWQITFDILDTNSIEYKYTRGDWNRVEKIADGNGEITNRTLTANYGVTGTQTRNDTIANWRDPLVVSTNPANGATGVPTGSTIQIVWNQDLPVDINSCVTVTGPLGAVSGTWAFDAPSNTSTFTPSALLAIGTHTVNIAGCVDVGGDSQQVPYNFSFDVGLPAGMVAVTFEVTVPSHTPTGVYLVGGFGSAGYPNWDPSGIAMTQISSTLWRTTLILPDGGYFEYKFTRNAWSNEEMQANGYSGISNRNVTVVDGGGQTQTVTDTVANWRDPYVISVSPPNASVNNPPNSTVVITWNKDMPAISGTFTVTDSASVPVTGSISTGTNSHTFTPSASLPDDTYSVAVSGNLDWNGEAQQVPFASTFNVANIAGVNVTFRVTVPSHTPGTVHLVGTFASVGGVDWGHMPMTNVGANVWELTFNTVPVGTTFQYKYTRGSWETVEKEADGNTEILGGANRTYTVPGMPSINDTVANWRDPYVISSSPADGASFTDGNIPTITFTWNQAMPATLGGTFTVTDSASNPVTGVLTYNSATNTHTFTIDSGELPLPYETYTVTLSGNTDAGGDSQQIVSSFSFVVTNVLYDLNNGANTWFNLQWPPTITHTLSATTPVPDIYGQIWINGVTGNQNGIDPTPGLLVEVGYGPDGIAPNDPSWQWFSTTFNGNVGPFGPSNDEYRGNFIPTAVGNYDYLYRYSGDGGTTWYYGTTAGPFRDLTFATYNPADAGQLTVVASPDTTPPSAPTGLSVIGTSDTQIELGWVPHPNTDGDLFAFEVYRDGVLIATITNPLATSYIDTTVVAGTTYSYYIVALDTSLNASAPSNTVTATANTSVVVVTPTAVPPVNPPPAQNRPMLIIRFDNNNNFVPRGGTKTITLIFQNFSGNGITGTLELVLPRSILASNPRSTHGTPNLFQQVAQKVSDFAKRATSQQQTAGSPNGVRLDITQIADGDSVTLNLDATIPRNYTQATALVEARLLVNGQVIDTTNALLVVDNNIVALPATGETPWWRDVLIIAIFTVSALGLTVMVWRRRATA